MGSVGLERERGTRDILERFKSRKRGPWDYEKSTGQEVENLEPNL